MVNGDYEHWKTTQAEFRGFMKASIQSIDKTLDKMDKKNESQDIAISKLDKDVGTIKGQAALWGAAAGTIITAIIAVIMWIINKFRGG